MAPKLFITGVTGFVGGDFLFCVSHAHPEWELTCLVRDQKKAAKVAAAYPQARLVYGTTDDVGLIEEEASKADIVFHSAGSDEHIPSAEAIVKGLGQRESDNPAYYIHTSGAFILAAETVATGKYGERFDTVHDDWDHIEQLVSFPDYAPHRKIDKAVLAANPAKVKTAIVAPSVVYGIGRGPDKTKSAPLFDPFLKQKKVFVVGKGDNIWHNIHVQDLSRLYLLLAEAAVNGGGNATWNQEGYYLAENGSYVVGDMLRQACHILHKKGIVTSPEPDFLTLEESKDIQLWFKIMVGGDSRGVAVRGRKLLGWIPSMPSFEDELENALEIDARDAGLI